MELVAMILLAFPLGYLVRNRMVAYLAYIAVHSFLFTFQSLNLVIEWIGGSTQAFGTYPAADSAEVWAYGAVNLVIFGAGLGLVALGHRVGRRRQGRRHSTAVSLDPVA